jgi:chromosome segregation ATPase
MDSNASLMKQNLSALEKLRKTRDALEEEVSHLRHELRRVRDGVERMSGTPHVLEQQASQLVSNIDLCERELKENRKLRKRTIEQIKSLEN